jgi:hypothetical protein
MTRDPAGAPAPRAPAAHLTAPPARHAVRTAPRPTRVITQQRRVFAPPPIPPLRGGLPRYAVLASERAQVRAGPNRPSREFHSTRRGQSCILVNVHRSSGGCLVACLDNSSLAPLRPVNNLLINYN